MTKDEIFELYKRVQQKDKKAEDLLIKKHKEKYGNKHLNNITRGKSPDYREYLHIMYLQLHR